MQWILFGIFLIVETLVFAFLWVIRYHFRMFSLPNDRRAKRLVRTLTVGVLVLFFAAGYALAVFVTS